MYPLRWKLGMPRMICKDCEGHSGGLALYWKRGVEVELRWKRRYHIDMNVTWENESKWRLTHVYGESKARENESILNLLRTLHVQNDLTWLGFGDF